MQHIIALTCSMKEFSVLVFNVVIHHRVSDGDIRQYASLDTGLLLKMKGRKEIYSSEPEPKFPTGANSDILGVTKSNSPQRCTSGSAFNVCVLKKRPQVKEMRDYSGYRKCKIKIIKSVF